MGLHHRNQAWFSLVVVVAMCPIAIQLRSLEYLLVVFAICLGDIEGHGLF